MKKYLSLLLMVLFLGGCVVSRAKSVALKIVDRDLETTQVIAERHGSPEVVVCIEHLRTAVGGKAELLAEDTDGLFSYALKMYLLREGSQESEKAFREKCGPIAAQLMLQAGKKIRPF